MTNLPSNTVPSSIAAVKLGVTQPHVALLCRTGGLEGVKLGRDWFISESSLKARIKAVAGKPRKGHPRGRRKGAL